MHNINPNARSYQLRVPGSPPLPPRPLLLPVLLPPLPSYTWEGAPPRFFFFLVRVVAGGGVLSRKLKSAPPPLKGEAGSGALVLGRRSGERVAVRCLAGLVWRRVPDPLSPRTGLR